MTHDPLASSRRGVRGRRPRFLWLVSRQRSGTAEARQIESILVLGPFPFVRPSLALVSVQTSAPIIVSRTVDEPLGACAVLHDEDRQARLQLQPSSAGNRDDHQESVRANSARVEVVCQDLDARIDEEGFCDANGK